VRAVHEFDYLDLDLLIERSGSDYQARVLSSPAGQTPPLPFRVPFSDLEIENFLLKIGRPRQTVRRVNAPPMAAIKDFGGQLFEAVFRSDVASNLSSSVSLANAADKGLRIRLRLSDCPELADLPWEYLYDKRNNRFLCLSDRTPLVRYLDLPQPVGTLAVTPPLRVLVVIASPVEHPALDGEQEWRNVTEGLSDLVQADRVQVERLAKPTLGALQRQLRRGSYHVLHFVGHGGWDSQSQDGVLAFEDSFGRASLVSGEDLGTLLYDHRSLRLAVLNACEGARGARADPFAGTAQSLVQQGIPAVIAMQFEITDAAAIIFAQVLYEAVADGYPLDAATAEARKAIYAARNLVEWGTPVLYLRASHGHIFDVLTPPGRPQQLAGSSDREAEEQARREAEEQARRRAEQQAIKTVTESPRYARALSAMAGLLLVLAGASFATAGRTLRRLVPSGPGFFGTQIADFAVAAGVVVLGAGLLFTRSRWKNAGWLATAGLSIGLLPFLSLRMWRSAELRRGEGLFGQEGPLALIFLALGLIGILLARNPEVAFARPRVFGDSTLTAIVFGVAALIGLTAIGVALPTPRDNFTSGKFSDPMLLYFAVPLAIIAAVNQGFLRAAVLAVGQLAPPAFW
jgi:CHAT domain-containing protein